jgi:hypothetical protein
MTFSHVISVLRRRWYLAVAVLLVLSGSFATAFALYPPQYASRAVLVVTTPDNGAQISADPRSANDITNPLFNFQDGQSIAAAILIASAESPAAQDRIGVNETGASFAVTNGNSSPETPSTGPFIHIETLAPTADDAFTTTAAVVQFVRDDLQSRQIALRAPPATFLSVTDVVAPTAGEERTGNRTLAAMAALLFSLVVCVAVVSRVDLHRGRQGRSTDSTRRMSGGLDADTETLGGPARSGIDEQRRTRSAPSPRPRADR